MKYHDITQWESFRIGDLFDISRPVARNVTSYGEGDIPFVASGNFNNGVSAWFTPKEGEKLDAGNCITVSPLDGAAFYQPDDFLGRGGAGSAILILRNADLTPATGLFLATALRRTLTRFTYADQINSRSLADAAIMLPVKDGAPDWKLMGNTIQTHIEEQEQKLDALESLTKTAPLQVDSSNWAEFRLEELFTVRKGSRLTTVQRTPGDIPYIGASQFNNGVTQHIGNNERIHPGGVLTVCYNGPVGTTFYQPNPFWATDDVNVLYPKTEVPKEALLFVVPIIEHVGKRYAYTDKWKLADMKSAAIRLPQTADGEPDWRYMELFMTELLAEQEAELTILGELCSSLDANTELTS